MTDDQKKLSVEEVNKVAKLAYLRVSQTEANKVTDKLNSILGYVGRLNGVDTSGVEPMSHVHGISNVFREDSMEPSMEVKELQAIAPSSSGRFIKVPIVIADE